MIELLSPSLQRLHDDWDLRRRGRLLPTRADFDPVDLQYILGNLSLVDVLYDPLRFHYRVFGTNPTQWLGVDLTRKALSAMPRERDRTVISAIYERAVVERQPSRGTGVRRSPDGRSWNYEGLALPLSKDGSVIEMLLTAVVFDEIASRAKKEQE
jgi:hypothetical protein